MAIEEGVRRVFPNAKTILLPIADGGDGTLEALLHYQSYPATNHQKLLCIETEVTGPLGDTVIAQWGTLDKTRTAIIEMAQASGLTLVPNAHRDPLNATTYGTGELVVAALDAGCREIIIGLGGSATNDGGAGLIQALGAVLTDRHGNNIAYGAAGLAHIEHINTHNLDPRLKECRIWAAADVNNILCGHDGASVVYGPQKGATPEIAKEMDCILSHFAQVILNDIGVDVASIPGGGAAGGTAAGIVAILGAKLVPGASMICDMIELETHMHAADLILTGEGRLDYQTTYDKAPMEVLRRAKAVGIPAIIIAGSIGLGHDQIIEDYATDVEVASTSETLTTKSTTETFELVINAAERATRRWRCATKE